MRRNQSGVLLIEALVAVGVVVVLLGAVAVTVPRAQEKARQVQSLDNVRNLALILSERSIRKGYPPFSGKGFVLSLVAYRLIDVRNPDNLEVFFSPGDMLYWLEATDRARYRDVTVQALKAGEEFHELTSYAGRRNADRDHVITPDLLKRVVPMICDDDDGPVHHPHGLVVGYTDGSARFLRWSELGMPQPEELNDPDPFLGDDAEVEALQGLSSY